ncbi:uncharacterized protein NECHADRAFT_82369 [Fusarium vanettenii 77-13-4]|uniref:Heterokaryon incompatibility domain-containing protein n=1 Tax=Fusarium vanettenii (strain ATCC MYA-4622 / CBS 123669 / FGSC 9596 / NRRL 45880 / 77-13-4) TaxID=660122 RepID=C7ZMG5_FUSV7|nr:uncharacterized protein NECHADRAFT_82369 [Fusarium vanettenii 77-13-4]EEU34771.1 hypothetical protein NECHADRAFT_82369 [Fusarium vanettenii 77-13-4]
MYTKLRNDREIRLVTLKAGQFGDSISCCLRRVTLSKSLKFEALSYEWKQAHGSTSITCNGSPRPVTSNLALALRALRFSSRPRVLWVDAICINQEDPGEKAKQIPLMREIYASATSVLTWLGPDFPGAKEAFDILPYLCMVGVERHPTGKPDTEKMEDLIAANLTERPKHGSIIQSQKDFIFLTHDRDSPIRRTIPRHPELDDDVLFRFHDRKAWKAIDQLFYNTYFGRSWIIQEVAVAEMVYVLCGSYILPWDIFRMAYEGRSKLVFQRFRNPLGDEFPSLVPCVRDARLRYRNSSKTRCQDLATVLTSFSYSKQTDPRDIVYAALGLITLRSPCADIVPDYSKSTEDVFYEASCRIIQSRKDLYLWSCKTLMSRRSMSLPSWVPEWTMKPCEEALEFASPLFSRSLPGNPSLDDRSLFVDGHLLDVVDATFSFDHNHGEFKLVWGLDQWLRKHGKNIFGAYSGGLLDNSMTPTLSEGTNVEASHLLRAYADIPLSVAEVLRNMKPDSHYPLPYRMLNIEAMWSTLTAIFKRRIKRPNPHGYRLFLALLYIYPQLVLARGPIGYRLPHSFNSWIVAAILLLAQGTQNRLLQEIFDNHVEMNHSFHGIRDSFFVTNKGYFGRAPAETIERGQVVAVLGGAYVPYLLQKQNNHYQLISHVQNPWHYSSLTT